ncbi:hypothetical protein GLX30_14260 [Streptomyces sp. Tu 2975]|uniref:T3SS effector HopA1 family protein n=1 Tax=Streptomyces sp. Tu 2975 TaxID=2676871 RepID=UPI0013586F4E|nr:T3SS effector HopA1 family protein [Streptomyces sp. Tu 2975]QIP84995.1 hypothetical protein GLX30_14260 [Streptomyces sp. Tu 2975]
MNVPSPLAPALVDALRDIRLSADGCSATVGPRSVDGDSPRELQQRLGAALYEVCHTGRAEAGPRRRRLVLRDPDFERALDGALPHREVHRSGVLLRSPLGEGFPGPEAGGRGGDGGEAIVSWDGVRVRVPARSLGEQGPLVPGAVVSHRVSPARPALSPGFFYAMGSREPRLDAELLRVYVHITAPEHAPGLWAAVLGALEDAGAHYHAKVLSSRDEYPRRDALVVYLGSESWDACHTVARAVRGVPGTGEDVSVFAHRLGPGTAVAWEPDDPRPGAGGLSFGQHRAAALAEAVVRVSGGGDMEAAARAFAEAGADPLAPYRNAGSPELPER